MQQNVNIRFEFRDGIKDADKHSALIQAGYDQMNLMANLTGHITFADLFGQIFDELIPRIVPHVGRCADYGLVSEPAQVVELLMRLKEENGQDSFATLVEKSLDFEGAYPTPTSEALHRLVQNHGVHFPQIGPKRHALLDVQQGIAELVQFAGDLSYRTIWEVSATKDMKSASIAVQRAANCFVIYLAYNWLCCYNSACQPSQLQSDICWTRSGTNLCGTGATPCGSLSFASADNEDCGCC